MSRTADTSSPRMASAAPKAAMEATRSGNRAAKATANGPPSDPPTTWTRGMAKWSSTATQSWIHSSMPNGPAGVESPWPRRSGSRQSRRPGRWATTSSQHAPRRLMGWMKSTGVADGSASALAWPDRVPDGPLMRNGRKSTVGIGSATHDPLRLTAGDPAEAAVAGQIAEAGPRLIERREGGTVEMPHLPHRVAVAVVAAVHLGGPEPERVVVGGIVDLPRLRAGSFGADETHREHPLTGQPGEIVGDVEAHDGDVGH